MKKIVHISIYNRSEYTCMHTRNYVQTNRFANNRIEITWNGEGKFSLLCYARYARKLVASHLFRSCRKYRARNFPSPLYRRMRDRFGGVHVYRGRVHLFTNAQPRIPISKGYILDRPSLRRIIETNGRSFVGHWNEDILTNYPNQRCRRSISNCAALGSRFAYFAVHFSPWTSLRTQRGRR